MPSRSPSPMDQSRSRTRSPPPRDRSQTRSPRRSIPARSLSPRGSRSPRSLSRSRSRTRSPTPRHNGRRSYTPSDRSRTRSRTRSPNGRGRSYTRSATPRDGSPGVRSTKVNRALFAQLPALFDQLVNPWSQIVVEALTKNVKEAHIREIFGKFGAIKDLRMPMNPVCTYHPHPLLPFNPSL